MRSWIEQNADYDKAHDPESWYWRTRGPMASVPYDMCSLCGSIIDERNEKRCVMNRVKLGWGTDVR